MRHEHHDVPPVYLRADGAALAATIATGKIRTGRSQLLRALHETHALNRARPLRTARGRKRNGPADGVRGHGLLDRISAEINHRLTVHRHRQKSGREMGIRPSFTARRYRLAHGRKVAAVYQCRALITVRIKCARARASGIRAVRASTIR